MPHLATVRDPLTLAHQVKAQIQRFRFLTSVYVPLSETFRLYGSTTSCTDALIEATTDCPGCERHGEYEYLPTGLINEMIKTRHQRDPAASALRSLGLIKPDGSPLR